MRWKPATVAALAILSSGSTARAQHEGHAHHDSARVSEKRLFQSDMALMTGTTPLDPMMGMKMPHWRFMVSGIARVVLNDQGGPSGDSDVESSNWNMVMAHRDVGPGRLTLMMMNSLEPATLDDEGSPQLFQTGESFEGRPIVDRQHAHDFVMNLSATYRLSRGDDAALWLQLAPVGDPALGPTAFMHRASSGENQAPPLGHHWQDATHITSNVITLGGGRKALAFELSAFHGREPDEERWNLDGGKIDSVSARVTLRLVNDWSAQISHGRLEEPETLIPGDLRRTTASVHYGASGNRPLAYSLVWGRNDEEHGVSDSFLVEGAYAVTPVDQLFARAEYVEKDRVLLETKQLAHDEESEDLAPIRALTLGYLRDFKILTSLETGVGADATIYGFPDGLNAVYGESPVSAHVFVRLRWSQGHGAHHAHGPNTNGP